MFTFATTTSSQLTKEMELCSGPATTVLVMKKSYLSNMSKSYIKIPYVQDISKNPMSKSYLKVHSFAFLNH